MIEEELRKLTDKTWADEEKVIIQKLIDGFMYYRKLIPRSFKTDIVLALQMCNSLKDKLDNLIEKEKAKQCCTKCGKTDSSDSETEDV
jgi:hypothetical protein